jgi:hypothetical protein
LSDQNQIQHARTQRTCSEVNIQPYISSQ